VGFLNKVLCETGPQKSEIYSSPTVPTTGLRGSYFLPITTRGSRVASRMNACAAAGTNHKTYALLCEHTSYVLWAVKVREHCTLCSVLEHKDRMVNADHIVSLNADR
jgi:hypothetical protein